MVDHLNVSYIYRKRGVYYVSKRIQCDVSSYYKNDRIVICLRTKSNATAIRASKPLNNKPNDINLDEVGLSWKEMKEAIIENHKPIQDLFFKGIGDRLQFEDSCIAENVMLQFTSYNAPALPIHDNFIMHHGYSAYDELEEALRRAYHDSFKSGFKDNKELVKEVIHQPNAREKPKINDNNYIEWDNIEFDHLMEKRQEYSKWNDRNDDWMMRSKT